MKFKRYLVVAVEFEGELLTDDLLEDVINDIDYNFSTTNDDGIVISDTEIVGAYSEQPYSQI